VHTKPSLVAGSTLLCCLVCFPALADTLKITSDPPGATVEIDQVVVGKTPYEAQFPGGYFHGTKSVLGRLLRTPMHARVSLPGYITQEAELTRGPMPWVALNGAYRGDYYVFKTDSFHFQLKKTGDKLTGAVQAAPGGTGSATMLPERTLPELPPEKIVEMAGPAVLLLKCPEWTGTGFFITDTGVIATNAHVAKGLRSMTAVDRAGNEREAEVIYVDDGLDLALLKVEGSNLPRLTLAAMSSVRPGQLAIAIGNPGGGMPNTVTKGIVSAVGPYQDYKGTWIQTDAAINPGNSGGPLLNAQSEVIGINTMGVRNRPGINFAISVGDVTNLLARFYPNVAPAPQSSPAGEEAKGKIAIESVPPEAEVYVDGMLVGTAPTELTLPAGLHKIRVAAKGFKDWERQVQILKDSDAHLKTTLDPL